MPKLNITHLPQRLRERLAKLERGGEISKYDIEVLLKPEQVVRLHKAQEVQDLLRKTHKRPKTKEQEQAIGWKTKLEVRIEIYKQAIEEAEGGMLGGIRKLQADSEVKAAKVFMDSWSEAVKDGKSSWSAQSVGNIALTRAGFNKFSANTKKRDKEVWAMEDTLRKEIESEMSKEEKEQLELLKEHEKALKKKQR